MKKHVLFFFYDGINLSCLFKRINLMNFCFKDIKKNINNKKTDQLTFFNLSPLMIFENRVEYKAINIINVNS